MLYSVIPATFKDIEESVDIGVQIRVRVVNRISNTCLGSEVNDSVEWILMENVCNRITVGEISFEKGEVFQSPQRLESRVLQCRIIVRVDVVDPDYLMPCSTQFMGYGTSDKPCSTRH